MRTDTEINSFSESVAGKVEFQLAEMQQEGLAILQSESDTPIHREAFEIRGKLLRPRVTLLTCALGEELGSTPDWNEARRAALAIEFVHLGTLYHDDIVDRSETRRGAPSAYRAYGTKPAAFAGSHLISIGNHLASQLPDPLPRRWGIAASQMSGGQLRDLEEAGNQFRPPEDYVYNSRRKTGSVFELAAHFGGTIGGCSRISIEPLLKFARHYGIAFQLADDLSDFTSSTADHRVAANDLRERHYTLPVLYASANPQGRGEQLNRLLIDDGRPIPIDKAEEIVSLLQELGAFEMASARAHSEIQAARSCIEIFSATHTGQLLCTMLDSLLYQLSIGFCPDGQR